MCGDVWNDVRHGVFAKAAAKLVYLWMAQGTGFEPDPVDFFFHFGHL